MLYPVSALITQPNLVRVGVLEHRCVDAQDEEMLRHLGQNKSWRPWAPHRLGVTPCHRVSEQTRLLISLFGDVLG